MGTVESNKTIDLFLAEFEQFESDKLNIINDLTVKGCEPRPFNEDWGVLMDAVNLIERFGPNITIGKMFCEIKYTFPFDTSKSFDIKIVSGVKINAVNGALIRFIKWYNENK